MSLITEQPWMQEGLCVNENHDWWFPTHPGSRNIPRAVAICHGCPVRQECADYALENRLDNGIWGGLTAKDRERIIFPHRFNNDPSPNPQGRPRTTRRTRADYIRYVQQNPWAATPDIAAALNVHRPTAYSSLAGLEKDGLLQRREGTKGKQSDGKRGGRRRIEWATT